MNRIEYYIGPEQLGSFSFLREAAPVNHGHSDLVVLADEWDGNKIVRSWFTVVETQPQLEHRDGASLPDTIPPHKIVGSTLVAGAETAPPSRRTVPTLSNDQLRALKARQVAHAADLQRHVIYSIEWHKHLATIEQQAARIQQLEAELAAADTRNGEFAERAAILDSQVKQVRADLEALRQEKSITTKAKRLWTKCRSKLVA